jgi:hypothetical protein
MAVLGSRELNAADREFEPLVPRVDLVSRAAFPITRAVDGNLAGVASREQPNVEDIHEGCPGQCGTTPLPGADGVFLDLPGTHEETLLVLYLGDEEAVAEACRRSGANGSTRRIHTGAAMA